MAAAGDGDRKGEETDAGEPERLPFLPGSPLRVPASAASKAISVSRIAA